MLNHGNMLVGILEINRKCIFAMLNKLPYPSHNSILKLGRCILWLNHLQFSMVISHHYALEQQIPLSNSWHTPAYGSIESLANNSSTYLWIMWRWAKPALILNHLKLWNNAGLHLSSRWWPFIILSINLLEIMFLHWSTNFGGVPTCTRDDGDEVEDSKTP